MKRLSIILLAILLILNWLPAFALDTDIKVYDDADLFSDSEEKALSESAQALVEKTKMDIVIVTTSDAEGKNSEAYADDFYDYNGFGLDDEFSGILFLIDMDNRNVWISTTGKCIRIFTDDRIDNILDGIMSYIYDQAYAGGAEYFLNMVDFYIGNGQNTANQGIPSDQYNYDRDTGETSYYMDTPEYKWEQAVKSLPKLFLIGLGVGAGVVGIMSIGTKGVKTTNASTYLDFNSFNLLDNRDIYIRTDVTKRRIETDSGGGGGHSGGGSRSTTHTSSSGRSHGGGGRSF